MDSNKLIQVKDCQFIDEDPQLIQKVQEHFSANSVFRIGDNLKEKGESPLIEYDYLAKKWRAGRYVGELNFPDKENQISFKIRPRFGEVHLFHMLEEIFNVKLTGSSNVLKLQHQDQSLIIKKLISLLWLQKLAKANSHGLPRHKSEQSYKGKYVKGKLNVRRSILALYVEEEVVSEYFLKRIDPIIARILWQTYKHLIKEYYLEKQYENEAVKDVISHLTGQNYNRIVREEEYKSIRYGTMYQDFKEVVDFSWQILKSKKQNIGQERSKHLGQAFFLDIAEIWELYLLSLLKKHFRSKGWKVYGKVHEIYSKNTFRRKIIPDILMEKEGKVIVWDAKYKDMGFRSYDYDRADFFQIHTYAHYLKNSYKEVIGAGLLYPLTFPLTREKEEQNYSVNFYGAIPVSSSSWFKVDGVRLDLLGKSPTIEAKLGNIKEMEKEFLSRIEAVIFC